MNLAETFSKNYLSKKEIKAIKNFAQEAAKVLKDNIESNQIYMSHNNMFNTNVAHIAQILHEAKSEIIAKTSLVTYIASFARELNLNFDNEQLAVIGMKKIEKRFPFFSSNSIGFFTAQLTDEIKEQNIFNKEITQIIRRICSSTFYPQYILDDLKATTTLSTLYEKNHLENTVPQNQTDIKLPKLKI